LVSSVNVQTSRNFIGGPGDLLAVLKTFQVDFRKVLDRFRGCFGQISEIFWVDFRNVADRFQGCFGQISQISGMFWTDFRDFLGRFQEYSKHIYLVLKIIDIEDWTM